MAVRADRAKIGNGVNDVISSNFRNWLEVMHMDVATQGIAIGFTKIKITDAAF